MLCHRGQTMLLLGGDDDNSSVQGVSFTRRGRSRRDQRPMEEDAGEAA